STVVAPEIIVVGTERRLEGRRVDPIGNPIRLAATAGEVRIADQVAAACDLVYRAGDVNGEAAFGIEVPRQDPPTDQVVQSARVIQELPADSEGEFVSRCNIQDLRDVVGRDGAISLPVIGVLEAAAEAPVPAERAGPPA